MPVAKHKRVSLRIPKLLPVHRNTVHVPEHRNIKMKPIIRERPRFVPVEGNYVPTIGRQRVSMPRRTVKVSGLRRGMGVHTRDYSPWDTYNDAHTVSSNVRHVTRPARVNAPSHKEPRAEEPDKNRGEEPDSIRANPRDMDRQVFVERYRMAEDHGLMDGLMHEEGDRKWTQEYDDDARKLYNDLEDAKFSVDIGLADDDAQALHDKYGNPPAHRFDHIEGISRDYFIGPLTKRTRLGRMTKGNDDTPRMRQRIQTGNANAAHVRHVSNRDRENFKKEFSTRTEREGYGYIKGVDDGAREYHIPNYFRADKDGNAMRDSNDNLIPHTIGSMFQGRSSAPSSTAPRSLPYRRRNAPVPAVRPPSVHGTPESVRTIEHGSVRSGSQHGVTGRSTPSPRQPWQWDSPALAQTWSPSHSINGSTRAFSSPSMDELQMFEPLARTGIETESSTTDYTRPQIQRPPAPRSAKKAPPSNSTSITDWIAGQF